MAKTGAEKTAETAVEQTPKEEGKPRSEPSKSAQEPSLHTADPKQTAKSDANSQYLKRQLEEPSDGAVNLPKDYSSRIQKQEKKKTDPGEPSAPPAAEFVTLQPQPNLPKSEKGKSSRGLYSSRIENYRIPSVVIIAALVAEVAGYTTLTAIFFKRAYTAKNEPRGPALLMIATTLTTVLVLIFELIRFIATYCLKKIKTADSWKLDNITRSVFIGVHVVRMFLGLAALVLIIRMADLDGKEAAIAGVAFLILLSVLPIVVLAWPMQTVKARSNCV